MPHYQTYSTFLKACFSLGLEKNLIDKTIRDKIPYSTTVTWKKNFNTESIIGIEQEKKLHQNFSDLEVLFHPSMDFPRKITVACGKFMLLISKSLGKQKLQKTLRDNKDKYINFLEEFPDLFSYENFAQILGVSTKTLYNWKQQVKFKCESSALLKCVKRHPNQATIFEVNVIKEWLSKPEYQYWGIHSIWAAAFQAKATHLAKQSWYHYNKLLAIRKHTKKGKKPANNDPLKASGINEIWHADITVFKTLNGIKYYIYTVMDNYSRYIHSWHIAPIVSAKIRLETIQEAIRKTNLTHVHLVTDGGPENDNITLKTFMNENSASIHHSIALRDIVQSNSMMEAFYKITKYVSLYKQKIENYSQLLKAFQNWIDEYHLQKPHYSLGIYTPAQILNGADKNEKFNERMAIASTERRAFNKNANCALKCHENDL